MKFVVSYSQEKDIWNHLNSNWKFTFRKHGRKDIQEKLLKNYSAEYRESLKKAKTEEEARKVITNFLNSLSVGIRNTNSLIAIGLEKILNEKKQEIVGLLEKVYEASFPFEKITVYLTTANMCPYSFEQRWFMSGRNSSIEGHINTAKHELNHFMFYYYYLKSPLGKDLGFEKREILKEALAVFTNPEGNDKPNVKKLENYFMKNLDKTIPQILSENEWKNYF